MKPTAPRRPSVRGLVLLFLLLAGCNRNPDPARRPGKPPTIASLVPAATDLLLAMGAKDHLVAVSNYNRDPQTAGLPKVGDYESADWEKLAPLRPDILLTQYGPDRTPAGFADRLAALHIRQLNLKLDRLNDVYDALDALGRACDEPAAATREKQALWGGVEQVRRAVAGEPRVRAVVVIGPEGLDLAGRSTYLDDLLNASGGENAVTADGYVTLDREALVSLKPQVVLILMPNGDDATRARAEAFWRSMTDLPAVQNHRVYSFTQTYLLQPGSRLADEARLFASALHPASAPTTRAAP